MSSNRRGAQTPERLQELRLLRMSARAKLEQDTQARLRRNRREAKR